MPLNNFFNFKRFNLLLKQDLLINRTKYLLGILGLGVVSYLLFYWYLSSSKFILLNSGGIISRYTACFVFYMMAVGVVVGTAFPELTDKIKTANYLLSPASVFEKFLAQILIRIGFFAPIALGVFWIVIRLAKASLSPEMLYENKFFDPALVPYFDFSMLIDEGKDRSWQIWQILFYIFGYFSYGTFLFAGTTIFRRYALVKTVLISAVLFGSSFLFTMMLSHLLYPVETHGFQIRFETFKVTNTYDSAQIFSLYLSMLSWLFFLVFAYFKLKEKEV